MSTEVILTVLIPFLIVGGGWLTMLIIATSKKRRTQRRVEREVADYLATFDARVGTRK